MIGGVGLDHDMGLEPVLAAGHRLVCVPRVGVHSGDHPAGGDLPGDPPPARPVGVAGVRHVLDVLTGDQGQQPDRVARGPAGAPGPPR
jgi:hypothetical protein